MDGVEWPMVDRPYFADHFDCNATINMTRQQIWFRRWASSVIATAICVAVAWIAVGIHCLIELYRRIVRHNFTSDAQGRDYFQNWNMI